MDKERRGPKRRIASDRTTSLSSLISLLDQLELYMQTTPAPQRTVNSEHRASDSVGQRRGPKRRNVGEL